MSTFDIDTISAAQTRLAGKAVRTPLLRNRALDERLGAKVLLKPENLQHSGSFKFRGAYNKLAQIKAEDRSRGVVAWSSGNHAQGVAAAAKWLKIPATIVMPADAPAIKIRNTKSLGADIVFYDRATQSREDIARRIVAETGAILVPSYDDHDVMSGQGTAGLEINEDLTRMGLSPDIVLCCCGGGGLIAGVGTAIRSAFQDTQIYAVEPEEFDDTARSLSAGKRLGVEPDAQSVCDALLAPTPGKLTFDVNRSLLTGGLKVSDEEVLRAMRTAFDTLKLVVEPGGAVALAAALEGRVELQGKTVVIVISGGNVDEELFAKALAS